MTGDSRTATAFPLFAAIVGFVSVSGLGGRVRTAVLVWVTLTGLGLLLVIDERATPLALLVSVLAGHTVGVALRVTIGSENPRAPARHVVEALARVGVQATRLCQLAESEVGRRFEVDTVDRQRLAVQVFDPDRRTTTLLRTIVRSVRLRSWVSRSTSFSQRRAVEQAALPVLAASQAQVRTPALVAAAEVDATTTLYAEEDPPDLRPLRTLPAGQLTDELLVDAWTQVQRLHRVGVAHEALDPTSLAVDAAGRVWLRHVSQGEIAASALRLRLDDAELLTTSALLVGPERAVGVAASVLRPDELGRLLPFLQKVALSPGTRVCIREHRQLLGRLRDTVLSHVPEAPTEPVDLERLRPRTALSIVAATIAAYVLIGQLGNVDTHTLLHGIDWPWALVAMLGSFLTYVGAALNIVAFAPVPIPFVRLVAGQFAATFVTLLAPAAVGSVGTNVRLLQKADAPPPLAVASVGVSSLVAVLTTIVLFVGLGLAAGGAPAGDVKVPSGFVVVGALLVLGAAGAVLLVPWSRQAVLKQVRPMLSRTIPRLWNVLRDPKRLALGVGGNMLTTASYTLALGAAARAYGEAVPFPTVAIVYLGSGLIGSAAPTPGGIGAVEAALVAGLTASGMASAVALPVALLYRTVTFWLPMAPGWVAFHVLQRRDQI
jgi:uncharacterized membrane protein YbhN (UPF0104 family)